MRARHDGALPVKDFKPKEPKKTKPTRLGKDARKAARERVKAARREAKAERRATKRTAKDEKKATKKASTPRNLKM
jgi:hypothetical protein